MKTKNKSIIFFGVLIILLVIGIIIIFINNKSDRLILLNKKLKKASDFTFSIKGQNTDFKYELKILKNDANYCIVMYNDYDHTSTLSKDGYLYYIIHNEQEYYVLNNEGETDINILENAFSQIENSKYNKGKEEIQGKTYYYEEYEDITEFLMNPNVQENEKIKTRFYFEGNKIKYIKNIVGTDTEILNVGCEFTSNKDNFTIPSNYAEK